MLKKTEDIYIIKMCKNMKVFFYNQIKTIEPTFCDPKFRHRTANKYKKLYYKLINKPLPYVTEKKEINLTICTNTICDIKPKKLTICTDTICDIRPINKIIEPTKFTKIEPTLNEIINTIPKVIMDMKEINEIDEIDTSNSIIAQFIHNGIDNGINKESVYCDCGNIKYVTQHDYIYKYKYEKFICYDCKNTCCFCKTVIPKNKNKIADGNDVCCINCCNERDITCSYDLECELQEDNSLTESESSEPTEEQINKFLNIHGYDISELERFLKDFKFKKSDLPRLIDDMNRPENQKPIIYQRHVSKKDKTEWFKEADEILKSFNKYRRWDEDKIWKNRYDKQCRADYNKLQNFMEYDDYGVTHEYYTIDRYEQETHRGDWRVWRKYEALNDRYLGFYQWAR